MKTCFKCKKSLPIDEFYAHKMMADGHLGKCKKCTKNDSTNHRNNNIEKIRDYDRKRGNRQSKGYLKEYRDKYPNKYSAHLIVGNAIRDKKLFRKPCEVCGSQNNIHGHHDDYLEPLNVRWLCPICHKKWHTENGEGKNVHKHSKSRMD